MSGTRSTIKSKDRRPLVNGEIVMNEPTDARENVTTEANVGCEIVTNEPTLAGEIVTNEPTA